MVYLTMSGEIGRVGSIYRPSLSGNWWVSRQEIRFQPLSTVEDVSP